MVDEAGVEREPLLYVLRDDDDKIVAMWDEGRWWTPEESDAFITVLGSPIMRQLAEATAMNRERRRRSRN